MGRKVRVCLKNSMNGSFPVQSRGYGAALRLHVPWAGQRAAGSPPQVSYLFLALDPTLKPFETSILFITVSSILFITVSWHWRQGWR